MLRICHRSLRTLHCLFAMESYFALCYVPEVQGLFLTVTSVAMELPSTLGLETFTQAAESGGNPPRHHLPEVSRLPRLLSSQSSQAPELPSSKRTACSLPDVIDWRDGMIFCFSRSALSVGTVLSSHVPDTASFRFGPSPVTDGWDTSATQRMQD